MRGFKEMEDLMCFDCFYVRNDERDRIIEQSCLFCKQTLSQIVDLPYREGCGLVQRREACGGVVREKWMQSQTRRRRQGASGVCVDSVVWR